MQEIWAASCTLSKLLPQVGDEKHFSIEAFPNNMVNASRVTVLHNTK